MPDTMTNNWSDEETNYRFIADLRDFYKVEKWTRDGMKVDGMLHAGNNLSCVGKSLPRRPW